MDRPSGRGNRTQHSAINHLLSKIRHASILPICQNGNTVLLMKTISLKLPAPLANWLAKRANQLGRSRSDLVRQALEEQRQGNNSRGEKSCAELMAEFGGFFRGPRELSTNPKYMRDFGK
jgi:Arc/MetJ-type ribon-helix-helix transcriptional regulator